MIFALTVAIARYIITLENLITLRELFAKTNVMVGKLSMNLKMGKVSEKKRLALLYEKFCGKNYYGKNKMLGNY